MAFINNITHDLNIQGNLYVKGRIIINPLVVPTDQVFVANNDFYIKGNLIVNGALTFNGTEYKNITKAVLPAKYNVSQNDVIINGNLDVTGDIYNTIYIANYPYPWFSFNGVQSYGKFIQPLVSAPIVVAAPRFETFEIPGRNGCLYFEWGDYASFDMNIECWFDFQNITFSEVAAYLQGSGKLILDSNPNFYYNAKVMDLISFDRILSTYRKFVVHFKCQPFAYYNTNFVPIDVTSSPTELNNPGSIYSQPVIVVNGSGSGTIVIKDLSEDVYNIGVQTVTITSITNGMTIDSSNYIAYYNNTNLSNKINLFPVLPPGKFEITYSGGITSLNISPNYRNLC